MQDSKLGSEKSLVQVGKFTTERWPYQQPKRWEMKGQSDGIAHPTIPCLSIGEIHSLKVASLGSYCGRGALDCKLQIALPKAPDRGLERR